LMARMANAKLRVLGLPEALLRGHRLADIFSSEPDHRDTEVAQKLTDAIRQIANEHPHAAWYLPMAVGGHVDHRIVKESALSALKESKAKSIWSYEELFYAAETGTPLPGGQHKPIDAKWKMELCRVYWSQFTPARTRVLEDYAKRLGNGRPVERIWPASPTS